MFLVIRIYFSIPNGTIFIKFYPQNILIVKYLILTDHLYDNWVLSYKWVLYILGVNDDDDDMVINSDRSFPIKVKYYYDEFSLNFSQI